MDVDVALSHQGLWQDSFVFLVFLRMANAPTLVAASYDSQKSQVECRLWGSIPGP